MAFSARNVAAVLDRLDAVGIESWLDGGWAVDALLGEETRPHEDLDLIVRVSDVPDMCDALARDGFHLVRGELESNFVLRDEGGREVDVHPVRFDDQANGVYRMENGHDWVFPENGFAGRGVVAGRPVSCLTAQVQMLCHSTGYEPTEVDVHDMRLLNLRLGTPLSPVYAGRLG